MNVPNILTISRLLLIPAYMYFMLGSGYIYANQVAFLLFVIAASTDFLDGMIARKYGLITDFGKVMDPVADKIMVTAAMIALVELGRLSGWIVVVMLFRDFLVGGLRDIAASQGTIIAAGIWGKLKTVLQMIAICFLIFYDSLVVWPLSYFGIHLGKGITVVSGLFTLPFYQIGMVLIYLALIASVFSGIMYYVQYSKMFKKG